MKVRPKRGQAAKRPAGASGPGATGVAVVPAIEGYPMITQPGQEITWEELHGGSRNVFAAAGFSEVSRPTRRRVVMRIDF